MKHLRVSAFAGAGVLCLTTFAAPAAVVPFTPGDIVVYQVGDGSASLGSSAAPVFIDEYTSTGTLVEQIAMPTTSTVGGNQTLTDSSAGSDGEITLSPNGQYLTLTGYDAAVGTSGVVSTSSSSTPRTIGTIGGNGVVNTATTANIDSGNNIRSAVTTDGNQFWTAGAGGGVYALTQGSTPANLNTTSAHQVTVFNGQLYFDSASSIYSLGSGLPTSGTQPATALPGVASGSPYSFFFASVQPASNGAADTLYIADSSAGIIKYNLVGSTWVKEGVVGGSTNDFTGLTGQVVGGTVKLFATSKNNTLVTLTDSSGFGNTFTSSITTLATAGSNEQFDGVAFAPTTPVPLPPALPLLVSGAGLLAMLYGRRKTPGLAV
jgi:hypothetical protein